MRTRAIIAGASLALVAAAGIGSARAAVSRSLASALVIRKSSNRNQVWYAVTVDDRCTPEGPSPVHPYWRLLEQGADATEPLTQVELRYLGLERQENTGEGVTVALRAMPSRPFAIRTFRAAEGECSSTVETRIGGVPASVTDIYVKQKLFGVDYVLVTGVSRSGEIVKERIVL